MQSKSINRRVTRVRRAVKAAAKGRARLSIFRSGRHIYAQVIDDGAGRTVAAASSLEKDLREKLKSSADKAAAGEVGKLVAERWRRGSRTWSSTAAATSSTAGSKPWPTAPAKVG
jgi:large subunit ribosomal protein L18